MRSLPAALRSIAAAAARATGAELVIARVVDQTDGQLHALAVWSSSTALAAEIEGSRYPVGELPAAAVAEDDGAVAPAVLRLAERTGAGSVLQVPIALAGTPLGSLELLRSRTGQTVNLASQSLSTRPLPTKPDRLPPP